MNRDLLTMYWKETREYLHQRGNIKGTVVMFLVPSVMLGIWFPLQVGEQWLTNPAFIFPIGWVPLFLTVGLIADSFAGERERHTLETLLATRIPDSAIVTGKIGAAMTYALGLVVLVLVLAFCTVNIAYWDGSLILYAPEFIPVTLLFTFLASLLFSSIGVVLSLRADTVRQAHQTMSFTLLGLVFIPMFIARLIPESARQSIGAALSGLDVVTAGILAVAVFVVLDAVALWFAHRRFKRSKIIGG